MRVTALLVRWDGGWTEVVDDDAVAEIGRREACLSLGQEVSEAAAQRTAAAELARLAAAQTEVTAEVWDPDGGWQVGDTATVPGRTGGTMSRRITAVAVSVDQDGLVRRRPQLGELR